MDHLACFRPLDRVWFKDAAELFDRHARTHTGHAWLTSRDHVAAAIDDLSWVTLTLDGSRGIDGAGVQRTLSDATPRAAVDHLHRIPAVTNVGAVAHGIVPTRHAFRATGTCPLYGIHADFDGQPRRLYVVDRGTPEAPGYHWVAEDLIPAGSTGGWPRETQRYRRGHGFYPNRRLHALGATEHVPSPDKVIRERYFAGAATWWIVEAEIGEPDSTGSPETARAFGYTCHGDPAFAEWGYLDLHELETLSLHRGLLIVERDLLFTPARVQDLDLPGRP